ncbi:MAG: hypothetical protein P9M03_06230 [Candidatus Theseobacter exili]|jgi:hypothetical protein|nr:hypothetical protein [Candidatus Theseobacter exili]
MGISFYDVKDRKKVDVGEGSIKKTKYERTTKAGKLQVRYALRADMGGRKLTKFVNKNDWDSLNVPTE